MRVCDCLHVIARYIHILYRKERKKNIIELNEEIHVKRRQVDDFSMYLIKLTVERIMHLYFFFFY